DFGAVVLERLPGSAELISLRFKTMPTAGQFGLSVNSLRDIDGVRYSELDYYQFGSAHVGHAAATATRCASSLTETSGDGALTLIDFDNAATGAGAIVGIVDSGIFVDSNGKAHEDLPAKSAGLTYEAD